MPPPIRALPVLLLLLAGAAAPPEPATLTGRVTDPAGAPLAGTILRVEDLSLAALTDAAGRYRLVIPAARFTAGQTVTLTASRVGLASASRRVTLTPGASVVQDFTLAPAMVAIEGLVVTGGSAGQLQMRGASTQPGYGTTVAPPGAARFNTEEYRHIRENRFLDARANPRSTFSIDVDRASYANVRRFLGNGMLPPADAVRIEEMVNYFPYDYADPDDGHPFAVHAEVGVAPWNPRHRLVRVALQARRPAGEAPPSNLVFLIDVSGSMMSPDKLPLVKESLRLLVEQLGAGDRVALVVYAGAAGLVLDATSGDRKAEILGAIDRLEAGGSTAGADGIRLAYEVARRHRLEDGNNRVILATDGDFNVGISSEGELVRLIEAEREHGVYLTVLGVGEGNLADARMEAIADHGNGNYAYLDGLTEARRVLVEEVRGTLFTVARDVKIQVEFNPAHVASYRLVGYENRLLQDEDFEDDRRDAGEMGAGHAVTALYEIVPAAGAEPGEEVRPLRYQRAARRGGHEGELMHVAVRYRHPEGGRSRLLERVVRDEAPDRPSDSFRWAAAVAEFGMILRASEHRSGASIAHVLEQARGALRHDPDGRRAEFLELVGRYAGLAANAPRENGGR